MTQHPTPLKFLMPGWFVIVMGLSGLALAWHNATPLLGGLAVAVAHGLGWVAVGVALVLAVLSLVRWQHYPQALHEDMGHPVRHVFVAVMPISLILLATVATALTGPSRFALLIWLLGSAWQLGVTAWALSRWLVLVSLVIAALLWATFQGLRRGNLLMPEPGPVLQGPVSPVTGVAA